MAESKSQQRRGLLAAFQRMIGWQQQATTQQDPPQSTAPIIEPLPIVRDANLANMPALIQRTATPATPVYNINDNLTNSAATMSTKDTFPATSAPTAPVKRAPSLDEIPIGTVQPSINAPGLPDLSLAHGPSIDARLKGLTRYYNVPQQKQKFSTRQGVGVPSPFEEDLTKLAWYSADWSKRQVIYQNVDDVLANCKEAELARDEYLAGVFDQGCSYRVVPFKIREDVAPDHESEIMAGRANELWQDFERKRTLKFKRQTWGARIDYGFAPLEFVSDQWGTVTEMELLPPYGMEICTFRGRFAEDQLVAYRQHDALVPDIYYAEWNEFGIVWVVNARYNWHPYGVPALMAAMAHANGLVRNTALMPNAREAAQTQVFAAFRDLAGNAVDPSNLEDFEDFSRKARKERNEEISPNDIMIANGAATIQAIYGDSGFLNQLSDVKMQGAVVCAVYGSNYTTLFEPHITNRSIAEKLEEKEYYFWYNQSKNFTADVDEPSFARVIACANWAYARRLESAGLRPQLYINPAKVALIAEWNARRPAERLAKESEIALKAWGLGRGINPKTGERIGIPVISSKTTTRVLSRIFEFDVAEERKEIDEEMEREATASSNLGQPVSVPSTARMKPSKNKMIPSQPSEPQQIM